MACKKSELVSAINSYAAARLSDDGNLINFAANFLSSLVDSLEFAPENNEAEEVKEEEEES